MTSREPETTVEIRAWARRAGAGEPVGTVTMAGWVFRGVPCLRCGKKGLRGAVHPYGYGSAAYARVTCRYCGACFTATREEGV